MIAWMRGKPQVASLMQTAINSIRAHQSRPPWHSAPAFDLWNEQINTQQSEHLSGISFKIEQFQKKGRVWVIGGKTTGGNDDVFWAPLETGVHRLVSAMADVPDGDYLLLYSPHPFWTTVFGSGYGWIPSWEDIYWLVYFTPGWRIVQYSGSFDAAGRFFVVAQKVPSDRDLTPISTLGRQTFHVFYFREGADFSLTRSNYALSAHLCSALAQTGAKVFAHNMDETAALEQVRPDHVLIGHVGPWVKAAHDRGCEKIVLFNPANRWYPTRQNSYFEANATIEQQVDLAKMVIAQSGSIWRTTGEYPSPEKWRWVDLGIDTWQFPLQKHAYAPPGQRTFLFFHLYDEAQKGADVAERIIAALPGTSFWWIAGKRVRKSNVKYVRHLSNTSLRFRRTVSKCDFILTPSREDAQPGSLLEASALGLLPMATYESGYSLSHPYLIVPNTCENWIEAIALVQELPTKVLMSAQEVIQQYVRVLHSWQRIENDLIFNMRESHICD